MTQPAADGPAVRVEQRGPILLVTLDRPAVRNALNGEVAGLIGAAMDRLDAEPGLFLGIITGANGHFSVGADLKAVARGERPPEHPRGHFGLVARPPAKPLIAAVEGYAVGGGLEICLACDLITAARDARFGLPEVKRNLVAMAGGAFRLPRRIAYGAAMEMALTGAFRSGEEMHALGLVNRLAEPGGALDAAFALAEELLQNGPTALAATCAIIRRSRDWTEDQAWREQRDLAAGALSSQDRIEGVRAFVEKRKPQWKGV